ncbi:MFS transporter [Paucibacter sp. JuS9]|uniref:MFS transporter n=1 Tax=Paucibacter sp. JuS9 TaxID=3228748 RepID=UPI0037563A0A
MDITRSPSSAIAPPAPRLSSRLVRLLAAGAGFSVAGLYYAQPMLGSLAEEFQASSAQVGLVPTLTQLGYAAGILLLAPLGDRYDRRRIILIKAVALLLSLALAAVAPQLWVLWLASALIGLSATLAQDLVPAAAALAPEAERGKTVGSVMTGLLLGILLSRVVSGALAQQLGWRWVFVMAALSIGLLAWLLRRGLPHFAPGTRLSYGDLLASLVGLVRRYRELRRAALAQGLLAVAFSAFWSTLALMLHGAPLNLGSAAAGAFGLVGAAGALAAPLAGAMADKRGPARVILLGASLVLASFAAMALGPQSLWLVAVAALVFDLGFQASLVSHQSIVYAIEPDARSRLNAVLIGAMFIGMSAGSWLGGLAMGQFGWRGVCTLAAMAAGLALVVRLRR